MRAELSPCDTWLMPSERRLVIDGVGTIELLTMLKAEVVGLAFLVELTFLKGRDRLSNHKVHSVIEY